MNAVAQWLINAPVWIQTPLLLLVLVPVCAVAALVLVRVVDLLVPADDEERRVIGSGAADGPSADDGRGPERAERNVTS
ncbi:hypothetical protein [Corynebacterium bovis]|uniref:Uncharacterized protein n=1 Tax=Corynebacterium bovis DSM 20582 = CIP 54.80 TaxID=927655 RepID=A0A8I0CLT1_9CORY|nr:hypothetical protein [Corynebacterium bovis]MBB3114928.1 hypothetical protein [Corynebacterium bovis DSM 20582 = CIP 54.80]QQC48076.1 hypothetical protein I6I09_03990 [Corynebacterium bovis]WJY77961.1 hypothetical protein CBOVI_07275 [Corynebacterium bovis DSM 20582 = CIP 54.80]